MNIVKWISVLFFLVIPGTVCANSATLVFRDGRQVEIERAGSPEDTSPRDILIQGVMGEQRVEYKLSELAAVLLPQSDQQYYNGRGQAIVVSKNGKRFTIDEVSVFVEGISNSGNLYYFYLDPVTGKVKHQTQRIFGSILEIRSGKSTGKLRYNPVTKEYFPMNYNFDPYTGAKLEWKDQN